MADKDVAGVIEALRGSAAVRSARVVCTSLALARALPAGDLAARWRAAGASRVEAFDDPGAAIEAALVTGDGPVVIAGSLYLVGEARRRLVDDPGLRDPEGLPG
jgi:folylpolyglutamate synthase/dihydropteroate synthase